MTLPPICINFGEVLPRDFAMQVVHQPRPFRFWRVKSPSGVQPRSLWIKFGKPEPKKLLHIVFNEFSKLDKRAGPKTPICWHILQKTPSENYVIAESL